MNTWIFQSNPTRFDLLAHWEDKKVDTWAANQLRDRMQIGDRVYFRISGRRAGIYGLGTIMSTCYESTNEFGNWKVEVRYDDLIDPPLLRVETDTHPVLRNYRPLRGQEATNFLVPIEIASEIKTLLLSARNRMATTPSNSPWTVVNRAHVEAAISEWNEIGREQFLNIHGVKAAQKFVIAHEGHSYDAKAILVRAIRWVAGWEEMPATAFDGNVDTVAKPLRKLGFVVRDKDVHQRRYWWVNQNRTREEFEVGFMWSPFAKKNGDSNPYYEFMSETVPGDGVISFWGGKVQGFGVVSEDPIATTKPIYREAETWSDLGWMVDVEFEHFQTPFSPKDHISKIKDFLPTKYSPLTSEGKGVELYLTEISEELFTTVCRLAEQDPSSLRSVSTTRSNQRTNTIVLASESLDDEHEDTLQQRTDFSGLLEKEMLVRARRGQGVFRRNVRAVEKFCRVTGIRQIRHLRASHIKPWRVCNDREKIDGFNGLLLAPHIDHLFDAGWITFSDHGKMIHSSLLSEKVLTAWSIPEKMDVGVFTPEQCVYLDYHRQYVYRP